MKAKEGVVDYLNQILTVELTAINQYLGFANYCDNWGYKRLAEVFNGFQQSEREDADRLVKHILYLERVPDLNNMNQVQIGSNVENCLYIGLRTEVYAVNVLRQAIGHCASVEDYATRGMLESMIADEEEHVDWFDTQLNLVSEIGIGLYLSQQIH